MKENLLDDILNSCQGEDNNNNLDGINIDDILRENSDIVGKNTPSTSNNLTFNPSINVETPSESSIVFFYLNNRR